jgi:heme/copper-type cytochrome/quinol oxidase subunit 3
MTRGPVDAAAAATSALLVALFTALVAADAFARRRAAREAQSAAGAAKRGGGSQRAPAILYALSGCACVGAVARALVTSSDHAVCVFAWFVMTEACVGGGYAYLYTTFRVLHAAERDPAARARFVATSAVTALLVLSTLVFTGLLAENPTESWRGWRDASVAATIALLAALMWQNLGQLRRLLREMESRSLGAAAASVALFSRTTGRRLAVLQGVSIALSLLACIFLGREAPARIRSDAAYEEGARARRLSVWFSFAVLCAMWLLACASVLVAARGRILPFPLTPPTAPRALASPRSPRSPHALIPPAAASAASSSSAPEP